MCLAIPSRIISMDGFKATVDVYGARRDINLMLLPEEVNIGDHVLVHAGFALQKVDQEAAKEALQLMDEFIDEAKKEIEAELASDSEH